MSQDRAVKLQSTKSKYITWTTKKKGKNKKGVERKLEFSKFDPVVRQHVTFKEIRK